MKKFFQYEPLAIVACFWAVFAIDALFFRPGTFGIKPREPSGLIGIFTAPFFHVGLWHIISNTIPFIILGFLVRSFGKAIFWRVFFSSMIIGGVGTWCFSSAGTVVGASGLVFGFWAFLIVYGLIQRSLQSILISVFVVILYGSMFYSFLTYKPYISWSGHFFGALGGCFAAWLCAKKRKNGF